MKVEKKNLTPDQFETVMKNTFEMIEDAFVNCPNSDWAEAHLKNSSLSEEKWSWIITQAPDWHVFKDGDLFYIKTPDHKIETLENYAKRLEKALLKTSRALTAKTKCFKKVSKELNESQNLGFFGYLGLAFKKLFRRT